MNTLCEANGSFAIRLLKTLCQNNPSENVCYSPVSISSALAMVLLGAKGDTAVQITQALGLNTEEDIHQGFQGLLSNLNKPNRKYSLRVANRLFAENTCELIPKEKRPVQMMCREDTFHLAYVNEVQAQVLVMPYEGMELSMVVLLPDDGVDLSKQITPQCASHLLN
ncbi:serpin B9-like protein [Cricetulus griseus]|nr:serpin B9-like protein [Cricetulus griseus]